VSNYHARIMNIPVDLDDWKYKVGHRDARHAAAMIALEAQAEVERLTAELNQSRDRLRACAAERIAERAEVERLAQENRSLRRVLADAKHAFTLALQGAVLPKEGGGLGS
jgi:hypothetical protein